MTCPCCQGGVVEVTVATVLVPWHPGYHVPERLLEMRPTECAVRACNQCEFVELILSPKGTRRCN